MERVMEDKMRNNHPKRGGESELITISIILPYYSPGICVLYHQLQFLFFSVEIVNYSVLYCAACLLTPIIIIIIIIITTILVITCNLFFLSASALTLAVLSFSSFLFLSSCLLIMYLWTASLSYCLCDTTTGLSVSIQKQYNNNIR